MNILNDKQTILWDMNSSIDATKKERPFVDRQLHYSSDQNTSGLYSSNQIEFNTLALSNSGRIADLANAHIEIPMVYTVSAKAAATGNAIAMNELSDFLLCMKNSHVSLIHSVNVDIGTTSVVQSGVENISMYQNFIMHSEISQDEEYVNGPSWGYAKDSNSYVYNDTEGPQGHGLCNNVIAAGDMPGFKNKNGISNNGARTRCEFYSAAHDGKTTLLGPTETILRNAGENYSEITNGVKTYYYTASIPLKHLHPIFSSFPMTKGANVKIKLFLNAPFTCQITKTAVPEVPAAANVLFVPGHNIMKCDNFSATGGSLVNPITFAADFTPITQYNYITTADRMIPSASSTTGAGVFTIRGSIVRDSLYQASAHVKTQCRLYYPTYKASAKYESEFMSKPKVDMRFVDIYQLPQNLTAGNPFSYVISTTMPRIKRLILIAQLAAIDNGTNNTVGTLSSPFGDGCASCVPFRLENFQVRVDDNSVYTSPTTLTYEQYLLEQNGQFGINSNLLTGLCSSRLSKKDFETNYGYYVVNLENRLEEYDDTNHSIAIQGKLVSSKNIVLHAFVEYYKSMSLDVVTGAILA